MIDHSTDLTYTPIKRLGRGAFGEVWLARNSGTGHLVALKKIFVRCPENGIPDNVVREAKALQHLDHPNVVHLHDVFALGQYVTLAQEYCCTDLLRVLQSRHRRLPQRIIRSLMQQLLRGVCACHDAGIMHRDLKPSNVLLTKRGVVKVADFGLARPLVDDERAQYTHTVATRWYRAPELLYGARCYGCAVDMWSVGCIFAELLGLGPLFPGETDIDQLGRVIRTMGSIDTLDWPQAESLPDWPKISFAPCDATPLQELLPDASAASIELLQALLRYNPSARMTAQQALRSPCLLEGPMASLQDLAGLVGETVLYEAQEGSASGAGGGGVAGHSCRSEL